jgi:DNA-binding beta-propeller fold protein YncE
MTIPVAMALSMLVLAACGSGASPTGGAPASKTPTPLPSAGTVSAKISGLGPNDQSEYEITGDDSAIWVRNGVSGNLFRIDPQTNTLVATIAVGSGDGDVALGQGAVWAVSSDESAVVRIDPQTNKVMAKIPIPLTAGGAYAITTSPGAVWVTEFAEDELIRLDSHSNKVVATIPNQPGAIGLSFGAGSVWACNHHSSAASLVRMNPQTSQAQAQINPAGSLGICMNVVALDHAVWTTSFINGDPTTCMVERIDPATNAVQATIPTPGIFPHALAADAQGVWVFDPNVGVYRVDPTANRLSGLLALPDADGVGLGAGSVWVAEADGVLLRVTPAA